MRGCGLKAVDIGNAMGFLYREAFERSNSRKPHINDIDLLSMSMSMSISSALQNGLHFFARSKTFPFININCSD